MCITKPSFHKVPTALRVSGPSLADVGVSGAVGQEFLSVLSDRDFPYRSIKMLASKRSTEKQLTFGDQLYTIEEPGEESLGIVDNALFSAGDSISGSLVADKPFPPPSLGVSPGSLRRTFTYEELKMATDNFSSANFLGQGGFGCVHKGVLPNGVVVAIKQLKAGSGQGEREFRAEVEIINRIHHRNLVSLVGYCISGAHRLLVFEFVPNKTLYFHLHGDGRPNMEWPTRMKTALGSAKGLAYLHEDCHPKVIHRDIKSANILIDNSFEAKTACDSRRHIHVNVADFGLAKYFPDADTHVSTRIMGTFGYLDPEYAASGKLTDKSDIYSFGVVLVEFITGKRPFCGIADWARPLLNKALVEGNFGPLVDPDLEEYDSTEMAQMVACALASVDPSAGCRPRMSQIVRALENEEKAFIVL
ncbi:hypothetical protein Patl1_34200 [Pistacia atlantica]|uniref:Uncharacterized protein n=1 Tax=Pistacia atlantica TaxID=434234 RepID=A0ACC0ZTZ6_9ROSI|nr:hypothetical protein Patl1_34200 [Pistacia atlantica]